MKNIKKVFGEIFGSTDFYEDMSFLIPQILNYYDILDNAQSVIPYATVGIIFDSAKLAKNVTDIINNKDNIKKLNEIEKNFESNVNLIKEMKKIEKKNRDRVLKNIVLNCISSIGDILCFVFLTWIYGETVKVFAQAIDVSIKFTNRFKQMGRNNAKKKGGFYAKIFDMEKSTDNKINKKCEIMRLIDNEFLDYLNTLDYNLKNKKLKKLNLYVKILDRDRRSFGVRKEWSRFLARWLRDGRADTEVFDSGNVPFIESFVDVWQFQRFLLMLEFTNEIKKSIDKISDRYALKERLVQIKDDLEKAPMHNELELVRFLINHNDRKLENLTYSIMILGSNIIGEAGEFVAYFKDTVFEVIGLFVKFSGVVLNKGICVNEKVLKQMKSKRIENHAKSLLSIVKIVESLSLDYQNFYQYMGRLKVYFKEIDVKWSDIVRENDEKVQKDILIEALIK